MKKDYIEKFSKAKKQRWIAIIAYVLAPFGLIIQEYTSPMYSYMIVAALILTGFTLSFRYACPNCGQVFHIMTGPKKIKQCKRCSLKFD